MIRSKNHNKESILLRWCTVSITWSNCNHSFSKVFKLLVIHSTVIFSDASPLQPVLLFHGFFISFSFFGTTLQVRTDHRKHEATVYAHLRVGRECIRICTCCTSCSIGKHMLECRKNSLKLANQWTWLSAFFCFSPSILLSKLGCLQSKLRFNNEVLKFSCS